jgi:hypothetical protein
VTGIGGCDVVVTGTVTIGAWAKVVEVEVGLAPGSVDEVCAEIGKMSDGSGPGADGMAVAPEVAINNADVPAAPKAIPTVEIHIFRCLIIIPADVLPLCALMGTRNCPLRVRRPQ